HLARIDRENKRDVERHDWIAAPNGVRWRCAQPPSERFPPFGSRMRTPAQRYDESWLSESWLSVSQELQIDGSTHQKVAVRIRVSVIPEVEKRIHDVRIR